MKDEIEKFAAVVQKYGSYDNSQTVPVPQDVLDGLERVRDDLQASVQLARLLLHLESNEAGRYSIGTLKQVLGVMIRAGLIK